MTKPADIYSNSLRFAAGSVGADEDEFDFKESANGLAASLMGVSENVSVFFIYGKQGHGKSSYIRMVVESENLPRNKVLYTYISLTETNEAKDFSKLFAERWMTTLKERYPKIDTSSAVPFMQSVLRETGNTFIASILGLIPGLNKGLVPTRAKYFDRFYNVSQLESAVTHEQVANIFGNVPNISEELWIVVIDEIERALPNEIYRVVEVVERFKNEGRTGVPVKVLFLICISDDVLEQIFSKFGNKNYKVSLLKDFFVSKSGSPARYIPPISSENKLRLLTKLIQNFNNSYEPKPFPNLDLENSYYKAPRSFIPGAREFEVDEDKRLSRSLSLLMDESPRFLYREIQGLNLSYEVYSRMGLNLPVSLDQLLLIEYARVKYPIIWHFFASTIEEVKDAYNWDERMDTANPRVLSRAMERHFVGNQKVRFADIIMQITGQAIPENKKDEVENLVASICYWYIEYFTKESHPLSVKIKYFRSFNDPNILFSYLTNIENKGSNLEKLYELYIEHSEKGFSVLNGLEMEKLYEYTRFTIDLRNRVKIDIYADLAKELASRIIGDQRNRSNELLHDTAYQLAFLLTNITEIVKQETTRASQALLEDVFRKGFIEVLKAKSIPFEYKFIVLNSLGNNTRGAGSDLHFRLNEAFNYFKKLWPDEVDATIIKLFNSYDTAYFLNKQVIYDHEDNFFYVMYQAWSGDATNKGEIEEIRNVARRGLQLHPEAILKYWNRYPYESDWKDASYKSMQFRLGIYFDGNAELYMPTSTLLEITEEIGVISGLDRNKVDLWKRWFETGEFIPPPIQSDATTLRAVLYPKIK